MAEEIKRTYVVPLRRGYFNTPRYKRTNKAVTVLKNFLVKHMKSTQIKLGPHLNEFLWANGIKNPPAKVKIDVTKDKEGIVRAEFAGKSYVDFKMQDKVDKNQSFKEKLQNKVADVKDAKSDDKADKALEAEKADVKPTAKTVTKASTKKVEEEVPKAKEEAPAKEVEAKPEAKAEPAKEE